MREADLRSRANQSSFSAAKGKPPSKRVANARSEETVKETLVEAVEITVVASVEETVEKTVAKVVEKTVEEWRKQ